LTPEQAAAWRDTLQQLVQQGPAGAAAIRDFLQQNQDISFSGAESGLLGHASLRQAMFSALEQIGGPDAANVALEILRQTAAPAEIALLAQFLDKQAPGEYREQMLAAARDALAMASAGKLEGWDVGPLFQIFQRYGDASAVAELAGYLPQWKYYATMALAGMPSGEGIPALARMATDPSARGNRTFAWEMLAQLSTQYADASATLLDGARMNTIPAAAWPTIALALGGHYQQIRTEEFDRIPVSERPQGITTYHIASGNQNFYRVPQAAYWPQDFVQQRLALINQLLAMASTPQASQALQEQQRLLSGLLQR
ncbi:MAG: hypothetical protein L0Y58_09600, partial [Verrucomicrobia subdivision 3 bacterium]|nr:hypothetical protein [Limisphaerales bacterium]